MSGGTVIAWLRIYNVVLDVFGPALLIACVYLGVEMRRERCDPRGRELWAGRPWWTSIGVLFTPREIFDASLYTPRGQRLRRIGLALIAFSFVLSGGFALLMSRAK